MKASSSFRIGDVAKQASVSIQAIRYYERLGLLNPVGRRESGYRLYDENAVKVLHFIRQAQELGFSLEEIRDLLALRSTGKSRCEKVQAKALGHLKDVEDKIARLERMRSTLRRLIERCRGKEADTDCPIIASLEE